jgi:hypothetical protein
VTASASDNVGVTKIDFYVDNTLAQSGATLSYTWDTSRVANGSHSLQTRAYDGAGNITSSTVVTVNVSNTTTTTGDTTKPIATLVGISNAQTVSGKISVSANASDNVGVKKVDFYLDGSLYHGENTPPYCIADDNGTTCNAWDTLTVGNGSHTLQARAYDAAGNIGPSTIVSFTVQNGSTSSSDITPPVVTINAPANGSHVSGKVTITATASDNVSVRDITIYIDGQQYATTQSDFISTVWNTRPGSIASGTHTIKVIAHDDAGNATTSSITVTK